MTAFDGTHEAVFYGSVSGRAGVVEMLEYTGFIQPEIIVCRTSNGIVEAWLKRFNAKRFDCTGHRPRYMMQSKEWNALCRRAWKRSELLAKV